jgi:GNAT superfamily N-acetyltransferase
MNGHPSQPPGARGDRAAGGYLIEAATPADVPAIHALIRALAQYERLGHLCVATEADVAAALFGARPLAEVLIARNPQENGEDVGFALFFHTWSTFLGRPSLWLEDLFVRPEYRRAGIGRALLMRLAALAVERGCGRFEWSVLDWNASAIRFYEGLGASVLPDWRICRVTGQALARLAADEGT